MIQMDASDKINEDFKYSVTTNMSEENKTALVEGLWYRENLKKKKKVMTGKKNLAVTQIYWATISNFKLTFY
jgi:hypothetical protein